MAKKENIPNYSVILDTSFIIRLLDLNSPLHQNAIDYFRYFLHNGIPLYFSTISVAEYCVKGDFKDLPFNNLRILPFNIFHAKEAGTFTRILFNAKKTGELIIKERVVVPNDSKILAQGSYEKGIKYFVTSDSESLKFIDVLRKEGATDIEHLDIHTPCGVKFGYLELDE